MRRHRRYCAILICLFAAISLLFLLTFQLAAASPTITAEIKPSAGGKMITVTFSIENNPGIAAYRFTMHYDNKTIKPTKAEKGANVTGGSFVSNLETATEMLNVLWYNTENYTGNGELCSATFSVIGTVKEGKYPVTITYDHADIVKIIGDNPESVTISAKGMTASAQAVSIQSAQSNPAASTNTGSKTQSIVPSSSATSSMTFFSSASNRTSSPVIEVNSQPAAPDYTNSQTSNAAAQKCDHTTAGASQNPSGENSTTPITEYHNVTSYSALSQPSDAVISTQSSVNQTPIVLIIAVLAIALTAVIVFVVIAINKKKD